MNKEQRNQTANLWNVFGEQPTGFSFHQCYSGSPGNADQTNTEPVRAGGGSPDRLPSRRLLDLKAGGRDRLRRNSAKPATQSFTRLCRDHKTFKASGFHQLWSFTFSYGLRMRFIFSLLGPSLPTQWHIQSPSSWHGNA